MRSYISLVLAAFLLLSVNPAAAALEQPLSWTTLWGGINVNSDNDPGIDAERHDIKFDIKKAVRNCGSSHVGNTYTPLKNPENVRAYTIDFDGNGKQDIITDGSPYFGSINPPLCTAGPCTAAGGCFLDIYREGPVSQIKWGNTPGACPSSAANNTTCRTDCNALPSICPQLFKYTHNLMWEGRVFGWSFITVGEYETFRSTMTAAGTDSLPRYLYREAYNSNPVLKITRALANCNNEEIDVNHNLVIDADEKCVKYLQFHGNRFRNLYMSANLGAGAINDTRYAWDHQFSYEPGNDGSGRLFLPPSQISSSASDRSGLGEEMGEGRGFRLPAGKQLALQTNDFREEEGEDSQFICKQYKNTSDKDVFIPNNKDGEFASFVRAVANNSVPGIEGGICQVSFTPWVGDRSCADIALSCNETRTISAERRCKRSTTAWGSEEDCSYITDPDPIPGYMNALYFQDTCSGGICADVVSSDGGGGADCLPATTKITMADGTEREFADVHAGDMVMAFDSKDPMGKLKPAKVKAIMITAEMGTIKLNDMQITPHHKVVLKNGDLIAADRVKIHDEVVKADGTVMKVTSIGKVTTEQTVYNMDIEDADGYIAGGLRVKDLPAPAILGMINE